MSKSTPKILGEQHALWLFQNLVEGQGADEVLAAIRQRGRVERWGHAATVPVWSDGDNVTVVIDGTVVADRQGAGKSVHLTRGDAFGKTAKGRVSAGTTDEDCLTTIRETTICSIFRQDLREIWATGSAQRIVEAGRWFSKEEVEVPVWPLLGTMPTTRLARILLHLVENYGEIEAGRGRLPLTLRPSQLATLAGVSKKRASQVWSLFEGTELIEIDRSGVILKDLSMLRKYALG